MEESKTENEQRKNPAHPFILKKSRFRQLPPQQFPRIGDGAFAGLVAADHAGYFHEFFFVIQRFHAGESLMF
jgi:hypothetical protein